MYAPGKGISDADPSSERSLQIEDSPIKMVAAKKATAAQVVRESQRMTLKISNASKKNCEEKSFAKKSVKEDNAASSSSSTAPNDTEESPTSHVVLTFMLPSLPIICVILWLFLIECGPTPPQPICVNPDLSPLEQAATLQPPTSLLCRLTWSIRGTSESMSQECAVAPSDRTSPRLGVAVVGETTPRTSTRKRLAGSFKAFTNRIQQVGQKRQKKKKSIEMFAHAYTVVSRTPPHGKLVSKLKSEVLKKVTDFKQRAAKVPWNGNPATPWWKGDGHELISSYLKIMEYPKDLRTVFPFKKCKRKLPDHCPADFAFDHTLEWREKYRPWLLSPSGIEENRNGYVYTRGMAPTIPTQDKLTGHAIVWIRAGVQRPQDPVLFFRNILNTLDRAVSETLIRSNHRIGKFNCMFDGKGAVMFTSIWIVPKIITMLQDHFPNRLGMVFLVNLGRPAEIILNFVKPLLTKEVRDKIVVVTADQKQEILGTVVADGYVPDYLGGTDTYQFDPKEYYKDYYNGKNKCTDEEAKEYINTMPYHA